MSVNCCQKEENKDKRPQGFKPRTEQSNSAIDNGNHVEFMLCGLTFPTNQEILSDPDTAATVHNPPHKDGMINMRDTKKTDSIMIANGTKEQTTKLADIEGTICDKNGKGLGGQGKGSQTGLTVEC